MVSLSASAATATTDIQPLGFGDRLTVKGVLAWRSRNPVMGGGIATFVSSDMFKSLVSSSPIFIARQQSLTDHQSAVKPKARRWDRTFALVDTSFFLKPLSAGRANVGLSC